MWSFIISYLKIYVQLAEISLPIYLSYTHIKIIHLLQFFINLNLFYPPSRYKNQKELEYFYQILNFFMYPHLIMQLQSYLIQTIVRIILFNKFQQFLVLHLAFIITIYSLQIVQLLYKKKQPVLPSIQQYILQILPLCLFQPITLLSSLILNSSDLDVFSAILSVTTLLLLFFLLIMSQLFFVTPTQWLLRSRPFAQPYGNFFGLIKAFQFLTVFLVAFNLPKYLYCIFVFLFFLFPTLQMLTNKFRTSYSDFHFNLSATSVFLAVIYILNIIIYSNDDYEKKLIDEFYQFWIFGMLIFGIMSELRLILHQNCCTYQQIGQMLEFDKDQLTRFEQKEYKFQLIQSKVFHDKYLVTPFCPFKRKDVQETWFYNEKSSLSHFLNSLFTLKENLKSVQLTLSTIIFIYRYLKYPLQALFLIYRFQQSNQDISPYPLLVLSIVQEQIKYNCRVEQCQQLKQKLTQTDILFQLNVFQYQKSATIFNEYLKLQRPIVQLKINFWQKLINGYNSLDELKYDTINITSKIDSIERLMENNFNVGQQTYRTELRYGPEDYCFQKDDILVLKMFSWYFTFILNDFRKTFKVETKINELLNRDRGSTYKLNNLSIYHKKSLLLIMNGFSNKGILINKNKEEIANFFAFEEKDFQIFKQINNLMPNFISDRHNDIIENFICKGFTKLFYSQSETYALNQKGFIIPISLQLGNCIENNQDFLLTASVIKVKQTQDFIIFDQKGAIKEVTSNFFEKCILKYQSNFNIQKFKEQCYVQFFFGIQINRVVEQLKQAEHNEFYISEDRIIFQCPKKLDQLQQEFETYLKKIQLLKGNRTSRFSKTNTKFNTFRTQEGYKFDDEDKMKEIEDSMQMIQGSHIEMLSDDYQDTVEQFLGDPIYFQNYKDTEAKQLIFSLSFNQIGLDKYAYFVMEIKEIKTKKMIKPEGSKINHSKDPSINQDSIKNEDGSNVNMKATPHSVSNYSSNNVSKRTKQEQIVIISNKLFEAQKQQDDFSQSFGASEFQVGQGYSQLQNENRNGSQELPPSKKANFIYPASSQRNNLADESDSAMENEIQELKQKYINQVTSRNKLLQNRMSINQNIDFDQDLEQENQIDLKRFRSYTSQKKNQVFEGVGEHEQISREDQRSLQSGSSGSSYFLNLLYMKAHKKVINRALMKVIIMNLLIFILVFSFFFINDSVVKNNLSVQKQELIHVRNHVIFNQQYQVMTALTQIQLIQQYLKDSVTYSSYINQYIHWEMKENHDSFLANYQDIFDILRIVDEMHDNMYIEILVVNQLKISGQNVLSSQYFQILAEYWQQIIEMSEEDEVYLKNADALSAILFFRINLVNQNTLIGEIIEVAIILNDEMEKDLTESITLRIGIEIGILIFLSMLQYVFFKENKKQEEQLMMTMAAYHQIEAENSIFHYKYFINQLSESNNIYKIESSKVIYKKQKNRFNGQNNNKVTSSLASRIKSMKFSMWKSFAILILNIILIVLYYLGNFLIYSAQDNDVSFLIRLTFNVIEFQHHSDDLITIGQSLKIDPFLIDELYIDLIKNDLHLKNSTNQIMEQLSFNYNSFINIQQKFTQEFLLLQYGDEQHRDHLYSILKNDLCQTIPQDFKVCGSNLSKYQKLPPITEEDNNLNFIQKGLEGVFTSIAQVFNMHYAYELSNHTYDPRRDELLKFLNSDVQKTIFLSYLMEVKDVMRDFVDEIYEMTLDGIDQVIFYQSIYIFVGGFSFLALLGILLFSGLSRLHNDYHLLKKGFILIPFQALLSQNLSKSINTKLD